MRNLVLSGCAAALVVGLAVDGAAAQATGTPVPATVITMRVAGTVVTARIDDGPTSRDFLRLLPMTIGMQRYGDREYYGKPGTISVEGKRQNGFSNGDVAYWAPGGSFAVFFAREGQSSISDLIVMGKVTSDLAALDRLGPTVEMTIEKAP